MLDGGSGRRTPPTGAPLDAGRRAAAVAPVAPDGDRPPTGALTGRRVGARRTGAGPRPDDLGLLLVDADTLAGAVQEAVDDAARVRALLPRERRLHELDDGGRRGPTAGGRRVAPRRPRLAERARAPCPRGSSRCAPGLERRPRRLLGHGRGRGAAGRRATRRVDAHGAGRVAGRAPRGGPGGAAPPRRPLAGSRRETWLDLREARLDGMAAEIAGALAVGACCPVCGSAEHPHKARAADGAPDAVAEKEALRAARRRQVRGAGPRRAGAATWPPSSRWPAEHAGDESAGALDRAGARHCGPSSTTLRARAGRAAALLAVPRGGRGGPGAARRPGSPRSTVELGVAAGRAPVAGPGAVGRCAPSSTTRWPAPGDLASCLRAHRTRADAGRAALRAIEAAQVATRAAADAGSALARAVEDAGFPDADAARAALLDPAALARARTSGWRTHERRLAAVRAVLDEPGAAQAAAGPAPDLPALGAGARRRPHRAGHGPVPSGAVDHPRHAAGHPGGRAVGRCWRSGPRCASPWSWRCASPGSTEGKSADNRLQMRLSAYVLAYRLAQVVAAANERLARMSDRALHARAHRATRRRGDPRRAEPAVRDTGRARRATPPRCRAARRSWSRSRWRWVWPTSSPQRGAAATDLDTLFVDEGFGSLDADTLDDVMDMLDSLRDGGRVVGVVSHVAEMADRIPAQLRVSKSRAGSTLTVSG